MKTIQTSTEDHGSVAQRVRRVLVPTDFSECADQAFAYALALARRQGAEVHLAHVMNMLEGDHYSPLRYTPEAAVQKETPDAAVYNLLQAAAAGHDTRGLRVEPVKLRGFAVAQTLIDYAKRAGVDLIVTGTHGRQGLQHFMLGSITEEVVRRAPCDVLTVRSGACAGKTQGKRILAALDLSEGSAEALRRAVSLAADYGAKLDVLHVIEPMPFPVSITGIMTIYDMVPDIREQSRRHMERLLREVDGPAVDAALHVEDGHPAAVIVDRAEKYGADLIVVATHGLTGVVRFLLGSVAERVVRTAACPVLVTRVSIAPARVPALRYAEAGVAEQG